MPPPGIFCIFPPVVKVLMQSGYWDDDGPGWDEHPGVKKALRPVQRDDGIFWMSKEEFFKYFGSSYLCAKDMSEFLRD